VRSRWKEYGASVEEDPVYVAAKKNTSGSRPKELFEDLIVVRMGGGAAAAERGVIVSGMGLVKSRRNRG